MIMLHGCNVIRKVRSGSVVEIYRYYSPTIPPTRSLARSPTSEKKQRQNDLARKRHLARLLNMNFDPGDDFLTLTYSDEGLSHLADWSHQHGLNWDTPDPKEQLEVQRKAAKAILSNCLKCVKREAKKSALEFPYVAVTSDMDGRTGSTVRIHHHLVLPSTFRTFFSEKWSVPGWGNVHWKRLSANHDLTPLANYLLQQVRTYSNDKKYTTSRNLKKPVERRYPSATNHMPTIPPEAIVLEHSENHAHDSEYIRYLLP